MNNQYCDPETGICTPAQLPGENSGKVMRSDAKLIYVGDPMCSWCWGIEPALQKLKKNLAVEEGIPFQLVLGGLRPGGGDPWDNEMKSFLKHHWEEVEKRSGQPFGTKIFEREEFNYDTEPACRAVVAFRQLKPEQELNFFAALQRKFYVENEDPNTDEFYHSLCEEFDADYNQFKEYFHSEEIRKATNDEFQMNRNWGVKGYPAVLVAYKDELFAIALGYATYDEMKSRAVAILNEEHPAR
jgi:putative protein-disulfide isomerase